MRAKQQSILLGITSGIAAYKMLDVIRAMQEETVDVRIVMTKHAAHMVRSQEFAIASGNPVAFDLFPQGFDYRQVLADRQVDHIQLADSADLFVIAPATANCIAKLAHGIADDLLTTTALAATCPLLLCPSMNVHMWQHPAVQDNIQTLIRRGVFLLHPDEGSLACGYTGIGRLPDPARITAEILHMLRTRQQLSGKRILVTAGGTNEPIDGVRMITNKASGKMGLAIARECMLRGADVTLLISHMSLISPISPITHTEYFTTAADLEKLMQQHIPTADIVFHTAAVSDFRPEASWEGKLESKKEVLLRLVPIEKIITKIKSWNPKAILVGFKAVYNVGKEDAIRSATEKMKDSGADYIFVNDVGKPGIGFASDDNAGYFLSSSGKQVAMEKMPKRLLARKMVDEVAMGR